MGVVGRWGCALGTGHSLSIHLDVAGQYLVTACVYPDWDEDVVADEVAAEDEAELTVRGEWRMLSPTVISLDLEGAEVTEKYGAETAVAALPISKGMLFATASAMTDPTLALREAMAKIGLESAGLGSLAARCVQRGIRASMLRVSHGRARERLSRVRAASRNLALHCSASCIGTTKSLRDLKRLTSARRTSKLRATPTCARRSR